tara:strand:+ start:720 stop:1034 length:315 start_codon:yes stop_codon:yes gene_type:complete
MYKIRGKILKKEIEQLKLKNGDNAEKMLITIEETDSGFNHKHQFEIFGETKINLHIDKVKVDRFVTIEFYIKSNEWKTKFFNTLNVKDIIVEQEIANLVDNPPF